MKIKSGGKKGQGGSINPPAFWGKKNFVGKFLKFLEKNIYRLFKLEGEQKKGIAQMVKQLHLPPQPSGPVF